MKIMVNKRISPKHLKDMVKDGEALARKAVAKRIQEEYLSLMQNDESESVRNIVAERLTK